MSEQRTSEQADRDPDELLPGTRPDDTLDDVGVPVGYADAEADAAASGADDRGPGVGERDTEGVPVGRADADEDARQSGADVD
jgi:hypothetical protein